MDVPRYRPDIGEEEMDAVRKAVSGGWVSQNGPVVDRFERDLATFLGADHALATDSGTAAIQLALTGNGIGSGDEVVLQDFTYGATGTAILATGARPTIVDVQPETYAIDPDAAADAISQDTDAILVAHLFGRPSRMDALQDLAEDHDALLIEDAAQAFGAATGGAAAGTVGDVGCFSFSWNKPLSTAKGGAVVTNDSRVDQRMREFADYGRSLEPPHRFSRPGYNYRMDSLRAAIGRVQLERFETIVQRKRSLFATYDRAFADIPLDPISRDERQDATGVPCFYVVAADDRDALRHHLADHGIDTLPAYPPLHTMPAFDADGAYPVATRISNAMLGLPSHPSLTESEVAAVTDAVTTFYGDG